MWAILEILTKWMSRRFGPVVAGAVLFVTSILAANSASCEPPSEIHLPDTWKVKWYQWLSDNDLVVQYVINGSGKLYVERFDIITSRHSPLAASAVVNAGYQPFIGDTWQASPNGALLLGVVHGDWTTIGLDGTTKQVGPATGWAGRWAPDSKSWIELDYRNGSTTASLRSLPADGETAARDVVKCTIPDLCSVPGFVSKTTIMAIRPPAFLYNGGHEKVTILDVTDKSHPQTTWTLSVPHLAGVIDAAISPDMSQVCWMLLEDPDDFHGEIGHPTIGIWAGMALWVGSPDGSGLRRITNVEPPYPAGSSMLMDIRYRVVAPSAMQWMRGASRVSYLYSGRIWTIDVPASPQKRSQ